MKITALLTFLVFTVFARDCTDQLPAATTTPAARVVHADRPFVQDYAVKYYLRQEEGVSKKQLQETAARQEETTAKQQDAAFRQAGGFFKQAFCDRNGVIQVCAATGLLRPHPGALLYPGTLLADKTYLPMAGMAIAAMTSYQNQFVYLTPQAVLSNAWAGKLFAPHQLPAARLLAGGENFAFLVSDGQALQYLPAAGSSWKGAIPGGEIRQLEYDPTRKVFWILSSRGLHAFSPAGSVLRPVFTGAGLTCFTLAEKGSKLVVGTRAGYLEVDAVTGKQSRPVQGALPCPQLTAVREIAGRLWFGSEKGAFMLRTDGSFNYYAGERWLPGDQVTHLSAGPDSSVLVLTDKGLGQICFKTMTLHDKAMFYEAQVRQRHIRYGFNASLSGMEKGNVSTGRLSDSDNDGLWTAMYLGGQVFRFAATGAEEALVNCRESLAAMERLYTIHPVAGFPARSFARSGYIPQLADPERWQRAPDPGWDWKATTSSDEAIGHVFAFGVMAELLPDKALKARAVRLLDTLMQHIVKNDLYLVDYDGKPTAWGKWNPDYVNALPPMVGDRKLNASNIIAMLQTAYHFTKKEIYRQKAFALMQQHGYLENLLRPMADIGPAPATADAYSKMLSASWNHSDDEMYFLGYWGLYRYAFNDTLRAQYKKTILDHWQAERPEKEGAWNIFAAITGEADTDLAQAVWYLQEYPLDLVHWPVKNSHRQDITLLAPNFRGQTTRQVLPPDELKISRHNANRFVLDGGGQGTAESSAGDIWLLPYWMGRYLGLIEGPPAP